MREDEIDPEVDEDAPAYDPYQPLDRREPEWWSDPEKVRLRCIAASLPIHLGSLPQQQEGGVSGG